MYAVNFVREFEQLVDLLAAESAARLGAQDLLFVHWHAEHSDFARFNHARLRQAGTVTRRRADFRLIREQRVALFQVNLSGEGSADREQLVTALVTLTQAINGAPIDPYLLVQTEPSQSYDAGSLEAIDIDEAIGVIGQNASGHDLVGAFMAGPMAQGLWSNNGARHYFERSSWSLDYSIYARSNGQAALRDKAVKETVAGQQWQPQQISDSITNALKKLPVLYRPPMTLPPGEYRALLSPAAMAELLSMLSWGGFSARAELTGQSPLSKFRSGQLRFSRQVHLLEDLVRTPAPRFQSDGFLRPLTTTLIEAGEPRQMFCSPSTAREFSRPANGAGSEEGPLALSLAEGSLQQAQALELLDQGIDISNLWYLNFSDRSHARITGMTRFATLWVEAGQWIAPITPMRFDDSLDNLLGTELQSLGASAQWIADLSSYDWRVSGGTSTPSALVRKMRFTL